MQLPAEIDVLGRPALAPTFELPADVGVGVPLDTSSADIDVLVADEAVALEAAPAASANIALLSPTEVHTYPVEVVAPPVDVSPLKFGVVLNLLVSSLSAERGDVAGTVATLVTLAARMNQPLLQAAVGDLAALVGDGRIDSRARLMAVWDAVARVNVPAIARDEAPAWLGGLVTVRRVGEVSSSLPMAVVRDVREAMMEGDMVRVASLLEAAPLGGDARLDDLRARVARVVAVDHALARVTATYQALLTEGQL